MLKFSSILIIFLSSLFCTAQQKFDAFQLYGPYGSTIYPTYYGALKNHKEAFKIKSHGEDLNKGFNKLKKLNQLYVFELQNNSVDSFPEIIGSFKNLMYLSSSQNPLKKLPESFGNLKSLKILKLHYTSIDSFPNNFSRLNQLQTLEIQSNDADTLFTKEALKGLYSLKSLTIFKCNLKEFPKGMENNNKLSNIVMVDCNIEKVDSGFCSNTKISTLILDKNNIKEFPMELIRAKTLRELSLRNNQISKLPEEVANLRGLEVLDLRGNPISKYEINIIQILLPQCKVIH
tara:strand:+ start:2018 stop:2884 length:867 start_codon:yes stop_codon:yes gene_type:complete